MKTSTKNTPASRLHLALMRPGFEDVLREELDARFQLTGEVVCRAGVGLSEQRPLPPLHETIFVRQYLPRALRHKSADNNATLRFLTNRIDVMVKRSNRQSGQWTLHAFAIDDDDGLARARGLAKELSKYVRDKYSDFFRRFVGKDEFAKNLREPGDLVLQIYCPAKDDLWFSVARVDDGVSLYEGGFRPMKTIAGAPSRSASKLEEALNFMGRHPKPGDTAVDLGAAPGGWSLVLARHGADVQAIDHAELNLDPRLKLKGRIEHVRANGLKFLPERPVDWMVCDMVMGAEDTLKVLQTWVQAKAMGQFVVNVKLPRENPWPDVYKTIQLAKSIDTFRIKPRHLLHDRNEITLMGF